MLGIESPLELFKGECQGLFVKSRARLCPVHLGEVLRDLVGAFDDLFALVFPGRVNLRQQFHHAGTAESAILGKIGAGEKRFPIWREHHGHRPSAAAGDRLRYVHVDLVDIRPFFPVHLYRNEESVHHLRDFRIFE